MTSVSTYAGALIAALAFVGSPAAEACGYHNPTNVSRGVLNWTYPNSLYVSTAVWMAQRDGIIARADQSQAAQALLGYQRAVTLLGAFRKRLAAARDGNAAPAFSLVFIGPMLWSRYEATGGAIKLTAHSDAPAPGDVVIVSDEPVIAGLLDGRLTPAVARDLGLLRYYGAPDRVHELMSWLDRLSVQSRTDAAKVGQ
jgi:hypothetical protein